MPPPSTPHVLLQRSGTSRHAAAVARGTAGTPSSKQRLDFDKAANAVDTPSESLSSSPPRSPRMVATSPAQIPPKVRRSDYDDQHGRYLAEQLQAEREKHQATQVKLDEERHAREKEEEARREAEARAAAAAHAAQTAAQAADAAEEATERASAESKKLQSSFFAQRLQLIAAQRAKDESDLKVSSLESELDEARVDKQLAEESAAAVTEQLKKAEKLLAAAREELAAHSNGGSTTRGFLKTGGIWPSAPTAVTSEHDHTAGPAPASESLTDEKGSPLAPSAASAKKNGEKRASPVPSMWWVLGIVALALSQAALSAHENTQAASQPSSMSSVSPHQHTPADLAAASNLDLPSNDRLANMLRGLDEPESKRLRQKEVQKGGGAGGNRRKPRNKQEKEREEAAAAAAAAAEEQASFAVLRLANSPIQLVLAACTWFAAAGLLRKERWRMPVLYGAFVALGLQEIIEALVGQAVALGSS